MYLYDSILLNHLADIRHLIEYSIAHLIVRQDASFPQILDVLFADSSKVCQDCLIGQEFLVYFLQRDDFLHHVDTDLTSILAWHRLNHHKTHQGYIRLSREASYLCFANCDRLLLGFESNLKPVTLKGIPLISFYHLRLYPMSIRLL